MAWPPPLLGGVGVDDVFTPMGRLCDAGGERAPWPRVSATPEEGWAARAGVLGPEGCEIDLKRSSKLTGWKAGGGEVVDTDGRDAFEPEPEPVLPAGPAGAEPGEAELAGEAVAPDLSIARRGLSMVSFEGKAGEGGGLEGKWREKEDSGEKTSSQQRGWGVMRWVLTD